MSNFKQGRQTGVGARLALPMTTAQRTAFTPAIGQQVWDTDTSELYIGDGSTAGGVAVGGGGGGGGGALVALDTDSVTNVASVDFAIPSGYTKYLLVIHTAKGFTDNASLLIRVSDDGGTTFESAGYETEGVAHIATNTADLSGSASASGINLFTAGQGTAPVEVGNVDVWITNPRSGTYKTSFRFSSDYQNGAGNHIWEGGGGMYDTAVDTDFLQLLMTSGNIEELSYTLFGMDLTV